MAEPRRKPKPDIRILRSGQQNVWIHGYCFECHRLHCRCRIPSRLLKFAKPAIWAKAISEPHAEILEQLGVHHVIRPEHYMGRRVAHRGTKDKAEAFSALI